MTKGGLYIPLQEHVRIFCSTPQYIKCHQYLRGCELIQQTAKKYDFIVDGGRRQFRRVPEHVPLSVSSCDANRQPLEMLAKEAITVDMSLGGLRLESICRIPADTEVLLDFGPGFSTPELRGVGKVAWCESKANSTLFEVGIAFSDFCLTRAVGYHLGLPTM